MSILDKWFSGFKNNSNNGGSPSRPEEYEQSWEIKKIVRETPEAVSLVFDKPKDFAYQAGQFVTVRATIDDRIISREYSFSSAPYQDYIALTIKAISGGVFSHYANEKLRVGDTLSIKGPQGFFTLDSGPERSKVYAAFAGGSGITPIYSMIKSALNYDNKTIFKLYYANKNIDSIIFYDKLEKLRKDYPSRLDVSYILEDPSGSMHWEERPKIGMINNNMLSTILYRDLDGLAVTNYLICGPSGMLQVIRAFLSEENIPDQKIKYELFSSANTALTGESAQLVSQDSTITFVYRGKKESIAYEDPSRSILDTILDAGYDVPYSCLGGTCGTCNCKLNSGHITYETMIALNDQQVQDGYILSCSTYPTTPEIEIDFDDYIL